MINPLNILFGQFDNWIFRRINYEKIKEGNNLSGWDYGGLGEWYSKCSFIHGDICWAMIFIQFSQQ